MKYSIYYVADKNGKSNCVVRSFCKLYNESYDNVYNELLDISKDLNINYNDIPVFEEYMNRRNTYKVDSKEIKIKDLELDNGSYIVLCYDKKDYYHMVTIIDNTLYDKNEESMDLYVLNLYKKKVK